MISKGIVVSHAFAGIGRGMKSVDSEAMIKMIARYSVARYAAYPTVWTTCQEYCTQGANISAAWGRVAAYQYALDPYNRPNSLHNCFSNPIAFHDEPWYTHVTLQQGHGMVSSVDHWLTQYNATPARPILEDEANYELLYYGAVYICLFLSFIPLYAHMYTYIHILFLLRNVCSNTFDFDDFDDAMLRQPYRQPA